MNKDAKGRTVPTWARYIKTIAAAGTFTGYKDSHGIKVPFGLYCSADANVSFTTIENGDEVISITLLAGYHPIEITTITETDVALLALFAYKPHLA